MPRRRRSSKRNKKSRILNSKLAIVELESHLMDSKSSDIVKDSAAKHLRKISMKSRTQLGKSSRLLICRGCDTALLPYRNTRTRIRNGMIISTCLNCGLIHRRGGGPKFHRRKANGHLEK